MVFQAKTNTLNNSVPIEKNLANCRRLWESLTPLSDAKLIERYVQLSIRISKFYLKNAQKVAKKRLGFGKGAPADRMTAHSYHEIALSYVNQAKKFWDNKKYGQQLRDMGAKIAYGDAYLYAMVDFSPAETQKRLDMAKEFKPSKKIADKITENEYELVHFR